MSDGDKWGIRLPRPRPGASAGAPLSAGSAAPATSTAAAADRASHRTSTPGGDVTAPAPVASAPTGPSAEAEDEGESGPYVDELFARIRAERRPAEPTDPAATAAAPSSSAPDESAAVAVAERPQPGRRSQPDSAPAPPSQPEPARRSQRDERPVSAGREGPAAAPVAEVEADGDAEVEEPVDPATRLLRTRDTQLAAVERELGRKLKRVLADEQNEVLDRLRRGGTVVLADVVPPADEHVDQFAIAATAHLEAAAGQGAALVGRTTTPSCDELAATLGRTLVEPLRLRIERSFDDSDGDLEEVSERLRALYREWKGNHIGNAVRHFTATAYARGAYGAAPGGSALHWLVDESCDACPDCDDNALAGRVAKGDAYPTGDRCAPAHPDCRCLVVPADLLDD
jgi:hypothetical protein